MSLMSQYYVVNTFESETATNYDTAIRYYQLKTQNLMQNLQNQINNQFINELKTIPNIEKLFQETFSNYNNNFSSLWEKIYNQKYDQTKLAEKLQQWKNLNEDIEAPITKAAYTVNFLNHLADNNKITNLDLKNTTGINFSSIQKIEQKIIKGEYLTAKAYGGARGNYFGEIFEQGAGLVAQNALGSLFNIIQVGGHRSKSASALGNIIQGKTDYGIFGFDIEIQKNDKWGKAYVNKSTNEIIPMEALEAIDLGVIKSEGLVEEIVTKYASGSRGLIGGMSMKQWTDNTITNAARTSGASFGRSALSAKYVNERRPDGITANFSSQSTFELYTAYAISRFLLNIIGVYNIIIASGSNMTLTHDWLASIKNSCRLVHTIGKNKDGNYIAYPMIKVIYKN